MFDSNRFQRLQQAPLWDFALTFYAQPGVEQACLVLQDSAGVDVCELLMHSWLYQYGLQATPSALTVERKAREHWQLSVTAVLRQLRRDLKPQAAESEGIAQLRKTLQQAELQAERENLQRWQQWILQASKYNRRITNCAISKQDVAQWLQSKLFSDALAFDQEVVQPRRENVREAINMLATQLDRYERPR
ncbi:TIGR02444 family protein [Vreelandella andesensis]|uniref:TIGR02444 family protein n=1 Tax=Vreelandella andesensis TaxID=447567 RepID=A0A433KLF7_9GAMM|nr:TIGR02444 family protein [Halomonas andesensis]RUR30447.1 TIGR02444 family protein [Halomonas andesensis]